MREWLIKMREKDDRLNTMERRSGAAIVELAFAMLLMFGLLLFILFIGQFFTERNRVLAASRTMAWIHAHHSEEVDGLENASLTPPVSDDMARLLQLWHFKATGPGAGVVRVNAPVTHEGILFVSDATAMNALEGIADQSANQEIQYNRNDLGDAGTSNQDAGSSAGGWVGSVVNALVQGFMRMLSGDFKSYEATVGYGMPLIFPLPAFNFFWGSNLASSGELTREEQASMGLSAGQTYVFLNPDYTGSCTFPNLNANTEDALTELTASIAGMMESFKTSIREDPPILRPHYAHAEDGPPVEEGLTAQDVENRLAALMIYEKYDPWQRYARKEAGIGQTFINWLTRNAPKPWFQP